MIFALKSNKIPEFYVIFAQKVPKFYIILARKIFFPIFWGHVPPPLPQSPTPIYTTSRNLNIQLHRHITLVRMINWVVGPAPISVQQICFSLFISECC